MVKNPPANSGDIKDAGSIPELGRSQGEGTGDPLQYSSLENSMDRGTWRATVHGITKSPTGLNRLSLYARMHAQTYLWMRLIRRNRSLSFFFFFFCIFGKDQTSAVPRGLPSNIVCHPLHFRREVPLSPGEGNGNSFQYSCLGNLMDRGDWQATLSMGLQRVRHD